MVVRLNYREILFAVFLAVAVVRITPFSPRTVFDPDDVVMAAGSIKQFLLIGFFLAVGATAVKRLHWSQIVVPLPFLALMGFALLSLSWSAVAPLATRRLAVTVLVAATILMAALQLRPRTMLDVTRWVISLLAVATILAGLFYPAGAIHQPGDPESSIIGAWRGIFYHKNLAGSAIGLGVVLTAEACLRDRRASAAVMFAITTTALILTHSKTAQIGAVLAILVLLAFKGAQKLAGRDQSHAALLRWSVIVGGLTIALFSWFAGGIHDLVLDPEAFTGRAQLWAIIAKLIAQHPLLGYGYESVFQSGEDSAMAQMSTMQWIRHVPHSHNGVLDLLVTVGVVGLALFTWAMFIDPWRRIAKLPENLRDAWQPVVAALMCYAFVLSLMEGKTFSGDNVQWITLVIVLGISLRLTAVMRQDARASAPAHAAA